ncbi:MAG: hypothetical protein HQL35_05700 [Alphaproteobacteria bacterium]|nr:hypothetical protein [Alphaproteobacteria bacterium]
MKHSKFRLIVILVLCLIPLLGWGTAKIHGTIFSFDDKAVYSEERNRYIALEFIPKYTVAECAIHFDLDLKRVQGDFQVLLEHAFQRYVSYVEPRVGMMTVMDYLPSDPNRQTGANNVFAYELLMADQCDRKDQIFNAMVAYALDKHGDVFDIRRVPIDRVVHGGTRFWLDRPDYKPEFWPVSHKAYRGDGAALMAMADFEEPSDHGNRYLYFALAYDFLPDGDLKEQARRKFDVEQNQLSRDVQKSMENAIRRKRAQIISYQNQ